MFIDLKPQIRQALQSNAALISLLGRDEDGEVKVYPQASAEIKGPHVTFFEITNYNNNFASDRAISSEIHFQMDIWTPYNTGPIAAAVNETMEGLGFHRRSARDMPYDNDAKTYHKVMRFSKTHYGG